MTITNVHFPASFRWIFSVKNTIERLLPLPCVCQKTPRRFAVLWLFFLELEHPSNGAVHTKVLVVLRNFLDEPALRLLEDNEVFDDVEQASTIAQPMQRPLY